MEELAWMMLVAAPFLLSAGVGLLFPRAWQRILFSGTGSAAIYAVVLYIMQADMAARGPLSGVMPAEPSRVAMEAALVTLPIGMCVGLAFHLITRLIRTIKA